MTKITNLLTPFIVAGAMTIPFSTLAGDDWAQFGKYEKANTKLKEDSAISNPKVVFMGNSITQGWAEQHPEFFSDNNYTGRGISGQTSYQMLLRFRDDVIDLHPRAVLINAGTNDVAENNHEYNEDRTFGNIVSMAELASANGITVILSSVLPADGFSWNRSVSDAAQKINSLNKRISDYADEKGYAYADYHKAMSDSKGALRTEYTYDGVHPTQAGYDVMENVAGEVIYKTLDSKEPLVFSLWENENPPVANGLSLDDEVEDNPFWISNVATAELFFYPTDIAGAPTLLMCPGGGYAGLSIIYEGKRMAKLLNDNGFNLAVLKYRMPNGNTQVPADDVWQAIKILRNNAATLGIDPDKIGIGGASAGGHLASTIATHPNPEIPTPAFQVLLYPVISMQDKITHQGSQEHLLGENPSQELKDAYTNELCVTSDTPPAFIVLSADDDIVHPINSINYFQALNEKNVPVAMYIYPSGGHGWGVNSDFKYSKEWQAELLSWMKDLYPQNKQ